MRKSFGVVLPLATVGFGVGLMAFYSSCGNTGGGVNLAAAFGQFVSQSCSPEGPNGGGNCLSLAAPNAVPADGTTISGFRAQLVDGSGVPLPGVRICFAFENPAVATITEPTNACGLTDGNGLVSGQFRSGTNTGSFALVATAPAGFGLQTRRTILFVPSGTVVQDGNVGAPCASDTDCNAALFCSFNDTCYGGASVCTSKGGTGACCTDDSECLTSCDPDTNTCAAGAATPTPVPTPVPAGGACNSQGDCAAGLFCSSGDCGGVPAPNICSAKKATGSCCTFSNECISGTCTGAGTCS